MTTRTLPPAPPLVSAPPPGSTVRANESKGSTSEPPAPVDAAADEVELSESGPARWKTAVLLTLAAMGAWQSAAAAQPAAPPSMSVALADRLFNAAASLWQSEAPQVPETLWQEPLQLGSTGERVRRFQEYLNHYQPVEATGVFDEATDEAVKAFQADNSQRADGIVGERTFGVLFSKLFWEKNIVADLDGPELAASLPEKIRVVVDLEDQRLFLVDATTGNAVREYPVSTGSSEFPTPQKRFKVSHRHEKPTWNPPPSKWAEGEKKVGPGPNNPLGPVALRLSGSTILIHGVPVSKFSTLGKEGASHGCIRMFPQHVWGLSKVLGVGTQVDVVAHSDLEVVR